MSSKKLSGKTIYLIVWISLLAIILAAIFVVGLPSGEKAETIKEVMRDGVLHEDNKISLFGLLVNPALISAYIVSAALIIGAVIIRIFVIPHFKTVPGKFQLILEELVGFFSGMAKTNSPHKTPVVGSYIFGAGCYIFFSTIFELLGIQAVTTKGHSIALPAPIADINGAIAMGITSYAFILIAGAVCNGAKGVLGVLKDFSLPISMSFRLFGALLSGLLVTELVYYYINLSFVLPVIVGVLFTLLHALIQTYVLTMLTAMYFGEVSEPQPKKVKKAKKTKHEKIQAQA